MAPSTEPPPPPVQVNVARVVAQSGTVEVRRAEAETWGPIEVGDTLQASDAVRTSSDGQIEVTVGQIKVRVKERSELRVKTITETALRAQLRGRAESEVTPGKGVLELEGEGSDAVARSEGGRFTMSSDGRGVVAVASVQGRVKLTAAGKDVTVNEGQISRVRPKKAPDRPTKALRRVLLAVDWPDTKETNKRRMPLTGRVELGTEVIIQGKPIAVDANGRFKAEVSLVNGRQSVAVVAVDVLGRERRASEKFLVDASLPDVEVKEKLWQ